MDSVEIREGRTVSIEKKECTPLGALFLFGDILQFTLLRRKPRLRAEAHFGAQARALPMGFHFLEEFSLSFKLVSLQCC